MAIIGGIPYFQTNPCFKDYQIPRLQAELIPRSHALMTQDHDVNVDNILIKINEDNWDE